MISFARPLFPLTCAREEGARLPRLLYEAPLRWWLSPLKVNAGDIKIYCTWEAGRLSEIFITEYAYYYILMQNPAV
jgi:hypothetical protein